MKFFEMIQRAAMEKTHSSAIAWLFSDSNSSFNDNEKKQLISALTRIQIDGEFINVFTEYKNIDVLLVYKDHVVAIENKIKISEHDQQIEKYDGILLKDFPTKLIVKVFLTLIGENASNSEWLTLSYDQLLAELKSLRPSSEIICDYVENLDLLVKCKQQFLIDHTSFPNVFRDGSKRKYEKTHQSDKCALAKYISDNGLETIFQRAFLFKLKKEITTISSRHVFINETRGNALLDYKNPSELPELTLDGKIVDIGIQFQGKTLKIQFENGFDRYGKRKERNLSIRVVLDNYIKDIFVQLDLKSYGWRINFPRSKDSEYYSFSKNIPFNDEKIGFAENSFDDCVKAIQCGYIECKEVLEKLRFQFR